MTSETRNRWNLFLCSFTILFVELMCIRWIPAYVRALGFFTNFVLLGSFLGIGLGILHARRRVDLVPSSPSPWPCWSASSRCSRSSSALARRRRYSTAWSSTGPSRSSSCRSSSSPSPCCSHCWARTWGGSSRPSPPLTAYTIDIAGSIAGTALFALVSFLGTQPAVWFLIGALAMLALPQPRGLAASSTR